jgi:ribosomal protein L7/L12
MPDALLLLVAVALIAAVTLGAILIRRRGGGSDLVPPDLATRTSTRPSRTGPPPARRAGSTEAPVATPGDGTGSPGDDGAVGRAALVAEVQALMRAGKVIGAVKLMRERTGLSLADAKAAVDEVDRSGQLPARLGPPTAADQLVAQPDLEAQLRHLKQRGRTIEAIKLLRSRTGISLRAAKQAVDRL